MAIRNAYGQVLKAHRERLGMTQEDLARGMADGSGRDYIAKVEVGQIKMPRTQERRDAIARALGTTDSEVQREARRLELGAQDFVMQRLPETKAGRPGFDREVLTPETADLQAEVVALLPALSRRQMEYLLYHVEFALGIDEPRTEGRPNG